MQRAASRLPVRLELQGRYRARPDAALRLARPRSASPSPSRKQLARASCSRVKYDWNRFGRIDRAPAPGRQRPGDPDGADRHDDRPPRPDAAHRPARQPARALARLLRLRRRRAWPRRRSSAPTTSGSSTSPASSSSRSAAASSSPTRCAGTRASRSAARSSSPRSSASPPAATPRCAATRPTAWRPRSSGTRSSPASDAAAYRVVPIGRQHPRHPPRSTSSSASSTGCSSAIDIASALFLDSGLLTNSFSDFDVDQIRQGAGHGPPHHLGGRHHLDRVRFSPAAPARGRPDRAVPLTFGITHLRCGWHASSRSRWCSACSSSCRCTPSSRSAPTSPSREQQIESNAHRTGNTLVKAMARIWPREGQVRALEMVDEANEDAEPRCTSAGSSSTRPRTTPTPRAAPRALLGPVALGQRGPRPRHQCRRRAGPAHLRAGADPARPPRRHRGDDVDERSSASTSARRSGTRSSPPSSWARCAARSRSSSAAGSSAGRSARSSAKARRIGTGDLSGPLALAPARRDRRARRRDERDVRPPRRRRATSSPRPPRPRSPRSSSCATPTA